MRLQRATKIDAGGVERVLALSLGERSERRSELLTPRRGPPGIVGAGYTALRK
jgi:hypothetical protein